MRSSSRAGPGFKSGWVGKFEFKLGGDVAMWRARRDAAGAYESGGYQKSNFSAVVIKYQVSGQVSGYRGIKVSILPVRACVRVRDVTSRPLSPLRLPYIRVGRRAPRHRGFEASNTYEV